MYEWVGNKVSYEWNVDIEDREYVGNDMPAEVKKWFDRRNDKLKRDNPRYIKFANEGKFYKPKKELKDSWRRRSKW